MYRAAAAIGAAATGAAAAAAAGSGAGTIGPGGRGRLVGAVFCLAQEELVDSFRCFSEAQFQQRNASVQAKNFKFNMNVILIFCVMLCMILCTSDIQQFMQDLHIMMIYPCMR